MTMHQKVNVLIFYKKCPKRVVLNKFGYLLVFIFSPSCLLKKNYQNFIIAIFFRPWAPAFFYQIASPTAKPVGPCQWIMWALKYVFWGP